MPGPGMPPPPPGGGGFGMGPGGGWKRGAFRGYRDLSMPRPSSGGGPITSTGDPILDIVNGFDSFGSAVRRCQMQKRSFFKSVIGGFRYKFGAPLKSNTMATVIAEEDERLGEYKQQLKSKQITEAEFAKFEKQCKLRKMSAAKEYYDYLYDIGYVSKSIRDQFMTEFAANLGFTYSAPSAPTTGRTR